MGGEIAVHTLLVIPARYESGRFPGKPLVMIDGVPMIERTYRRCAAGFPAERIYVTTDDERIRAHCDRVGIKAVMTSRDCLTGTDRLAEFARQHPADTYINVQGDEPLFNPGDIELFVNAIPRHPESILNGYCEIADEEMFRSPSMPKVVFDERKRLLYMSRASIPTNKLFGFEKAWRQVCIYAFPRAALLAFGERKSKGTLEQIEDIEILRFVELGYSVHMVETSSESVPVDHPEDVAKVERIIREQGGSSR